MKTKSKKEKENNSLSLSESENNNNNNEADSSSTKLMYIILIYIFYIFGGLLNEKLTKSTYEYKDNNNNIQTFRFKYPIIILCTLSSFSLIISSYMSEK